MEGLIPQATAPATHSLFQFKQNFWLKPPKAQPFQVYSWFSPQGEFSEPLSLILCYVLMGFPRGLCICAVHKCMEGLGTVPCLSSCALSKGLSACERHVSLKSGHPGRLPLFHNLHKDTVCAALTGVGRSGSFLHPNYILWEPA